MELGIWRCQWGQFFRADVYSMSYQRNYKAADPVAECDDRNRLYSLEYNLNYSGGHPGSITRQTYVIFPLPLIFPLQLTEQANVTKAMHRGDMSKQRSQLPTQSHFWANAHRNPQNLYEKRPGALKISASSKKTARMSCHLDFLHIHNFCKEWCKSHA